MVPLWYFNNNTKVHCYHGNLPLIHGVHMQKSALWQTISSYAGERTSLKHQQIRVCTLLLIMSSNWEPADDFGNNADLSFICNLPPAIELQSHQLISYRAYTLSYAMPPKMLAIVHQYSKVAWCLSISYQHSISSVHVIMSCYITFTRKLVDLTISKYKLFTSYP